MLSQWIRTIHSNNGVLTDYSIAAQNNESIPASLVLDEDYLYIGQPFPFNNFYLQMGVVNAVAANLTVEYWSSNVWKSGVDVLDGTRVAGVTMARNGVYQFSPQRDYAWSYVTDTSLSQGPAELTTLTIYDLYWARIKASANLTGTATIKNVSYAFCSSESLSGVDPEINEYLVPWGGSGKTNWDEQVRVASQHLVAELKSRQLIMAPGNVIRFDDVSLATTYRALAVIYSKLGKEFKQAKDDAMAEYKSLLNIKRFTLDKNNDAFVDKAEITQTVGRGIR